MTNAGNPNDESMKTEPNVKETLLRLGEKHIWLAPVGVHEMRGWMVCRRKVNNSDQPNTRVDYLRVKTRTWKKPFREAEHLFGSFDGALAAVVDAVGEVCTAEMGKTQRENP